jgi:hypothetical protein
MLMMTTEQPDFEAKVRELVDTALRVAIRECKKALNTDADWDNSYWNRAVEQCIFNIESQRAPGKRWTP